MLRSPSWIDGVLRRFVRDPRDVPVARAIAFVVVVLLPTAVSFFVRFHIALALAYLVLLFVRYTGAFAGLIHEATHRRLFVPRFQRVGTFCVEWVVCPLFGLSPHLYAAQHIGMHHPENNGPFDASATARYRRDSVIDFARYFARFLFLAHWEVLAYLSRARKRKLLRRAIAGLAGHFVIIVAALAIDSRAAIVVLVIPAVWIRFALAAGNWAQHGFVAGEAPDDPYRNTITCLHTSFNEMTFNSGFHAAHHARPGAHWSELAAVFDDARAHYAATTAVVFDGVEFGHVFLAMLLRRYDWLAEKHLDVGVDREVLRDRLRTRLLPVRA